MNKQTCEGCGAPMLETGSPIWEIYCSNASCTHARDRLRERMDKWQTEAKNSDPFAAYPIHGPLAFTFGQRVRKTKGSSWHGHVVGFYSTALTPIGYAVESEREPGSVQIYPQSALEAVEETTR